MRAPDGEGNEGRGGEGGRVQHERERQTETERGVEIDEEKM